MGFLLLGFHEDIHPDVEPTSLGEIQVSLLCVLKSSGNGLGILMYFGYFDDLFWVNCGYPRTFLHHFWQWNMARRKILRFPEEGIQPSWTYIYLQSISTPHSWNCKKHGEPSRHHFRMLVDHYLEVQATHRKRFMSRVIASPIKSPFSGALPVTNGTPKVSKVQCIDWTRHNKPAV